MPNKVILLAVFGGLVMSAGFVNKNWQKISARFSGSSTSRATPSRETTRESLPTKPSPPASSVPTIREWKGSASADLLKLPASERSPAKFRGLQTVMEQPMKTDEWSREVVIPSAKRTWWSLEVSPPDGYYIRFADDSIVEVTAGGGDLSGKPLPFRLLGKSKDQSATIQISNKPLK